MNDIKSRVRDFLIYKDDNNDIKVDVLLINNDIWLSLTGYPIAVFTGVYRIFNDKHWVGDVVAGAGIGILSAEVAYWLFPKVSQLFSKDHSKNSALVYPFYQNKTMGLGFSLNF